MISRIVRKVLHYTSHEAPCVLEVVLPNGNKLHNHAGHVDITLIFKHWSSFVKMALFGEYAFATEYLYQRIDVEGDLRYLGYLTYKKSQVKESHLETAVKSKTKDRPFVVHLLNWFHMKMHRAYSKANARYNAEFHYGHDPEFYFNYLGPTGAYSTGFWYPKTKTIEEAQSNKWELILKKLRLKEGMHIASVGSGFGYGELLAAEKYGVTVDCFNVCRPQNKWLRQEIMRRGLSGKVNVFDVEYRDLKRPEYKHKYDRLLVIECIEHAQDQYRVETFEGFKSCLKEDGIGIMQWLSYDVASEVSLFIRKFLYPGVTMPPLGQMLDELALTGFEMQDLICGRRHYYYTLNAWYENMVKNWETIRAIDPRKYNETFKRTWQLYLACGAYYLVTPDAPARLYQLTFTKGNTQAYPMNRDFLYKALADDSAWVKPHPWAL